MNIQKAIKKAIEEPDSWFRYERGAGYYAGEVKSYSDGTLRIRDSIDGESVIVPISLFQVPDPDPVEYACDLSRAIDECVRDARRIAEAPDGFTDNGVSRFWFNPATREIAFSYRKDGETVLEIEPVDGWKTSGTPKARRYRK